MEEFEFNIICPCGNEHSITTQLKTDGSDNQVTYTCDHNHQIYRFYANVQYKPKVVLNSNIQEV